MLPAAQREHPYAPSFFHHIDGTDLVLDPDGVAAERGAWTFTIASMFAMTAARLFMA